MSMTQRFKEEHDHLRALLDAYVDLMGPGTCPQIDEVMRRRLAFATAFRAHLASEGPELEGLRTGDAAHPVDRLLDDYGTRMRDIMPGYQALIRDWTPQRLEADWATYCRAARAQARRYLDFLAWEDAEILPLLDQHRDRVSRRSA